MRDLLRSYSLTQIAATMAVKYETALAWIHTGEIRAIDVTARRGQRPRWRIMEDDLQAFLARRAAPACPRITRSRKKRVDSGVIEFY
jgi:excisionase family DNA binding protein